MSNEKQLDMSTEKWMRALQQIEASTEEAYTISTTSYQQQRGDYWQTPQGLDVQCIQENIKAATRLNGEMIALERKSEWREDERDRRKAELDILTMDKDGKLQIRTVSTRKEHQPRYAANFDKPSLQSFMNIQTGEIAYVMELRVGNSLKQIVIFEESAGDMTFLLKKLHAVGAKFLTAKKSMELSMAEDFWCILIRDITAPILIPECSGWYKNEKNKLIFAKEDARTWKQLMQTGGSNRIR